MTVSSRAVANENDIKHHGTRFRSAAQPAPRQAAHPSPAPGRRGRRPASTGKPETSRAAKNHLPRQWPPGFSSGPFQTPQQDPLHRPVSSPTAAPSPPLQEPQRGREKRGPAPVHGEAVHTPPSTCPDTGKKRRPLTPRPSPGGPVPTRRRFNYSSRTVKRPGRQGGRHPRSLRHGRRKAAPPPAPTAAAAPHFRVLGTQRRASGAHYGWRRGPAEVAGAAVVSSAAPALPAGGSDAFRGSQRLPRAPRALAGARCGPAGPSRAVCLSRGQPDLLGGRRGWAASWAGEREGGCGVSLGFCFLPPASVLPAPGV